MPTGHGKFHPVLLTGGERTADDGIGAVMRGGGLGCPITFSAAAQNDIGAVHGSRDGSIRTGHFNAEAVGAGPRRTGNGDRRQRRTGSIRRMYP